MVAERYNVLDEPVVSYDAGPAAENASANVMEGQCYAYTPCIASRRARTLAVLRRKFYAARLHSGTWEI